MIIFYLKSSKLVKTNSTFDILHTIENEGIKLQFGVYLKSCRTNCSLTQEELVSDLYTHDIEHFSSLEATTISKWENCTSNPNISRLVSILKYFQNKTNLALPCFQQYTMNEIESYISQIGMKNLLGNSKEVVLNFPTNTATIDDLHIHKLSELNTLDKIIDINMNLEHAYNYNFSKLTSQQFKLWALSPHNIFLMCEFNDQFFGLLFTLRLKPDIFSKLVNFEMEESDIDIDDFASSEEMGSDYFLSFIALNDDVASLLFIKYYAQLIANQKNIFEVGGATMVEDAKKLINDMCFHPHKKRVLITDNADKIDHQTYQTSLNDFLACKGVMKMLFSDEES